VSYMLTETKQMLESESKRKNQKKYKWKNVSSPHERGRFNFTRLQTEALGEPPPTHIGTMLKISKFI
jgi:hypothetical protein